ncbi:hypothetical protein S245_017093, partial [Arachis hypogaea]
GTNNIEGIKLDLPEPDKINGKAFAKMKRLRILVINNALVTDEIQYLSDELRLIDWPGYPSSTLPPNFHPRRLVSLNMSHSHIKHLWKGAKIFRDLKLVSFSCCEHLTEIPDMSMVPNLESLSIDNCKSLIRVHESVGTLNKLVTLNLMFCSNLNTLPSRFKLKSLRNLLLTGCSKLRKFPEIVENMEHLEEILLQGTAIKELPQSIEYLVGLKSLFLDSCQNLEHLPSSLQKLQYLTTLNLSYCSKLQELPKLPPNTKYLDISDCRSLESFTMLSSPSNIFRDLKLVSFSSCEHLKEIPDFSMVPNLESLSLDNCRSLIKVHESVGTLDKLVTLNLLFCSNLKMFPSRFMLKSLHTLLLTGCSKLKKFPEIVGNMEHLEEILLQGTAIKELPQSIEYLSGLKSLFLESCQSLEHLPSSLQKLQNLTILDLSGCSKLQKIPKLPLNTRYIDLSNCRSLTSFPTLSSISNFIAEDFPRFYQIRFVNCHKLVNK